MSRRVAREIQIFVAGCRSTSRELHMAVEGVGQTDRQLHLAMEGVGQTDNYTWQWRELDRRTITHSSGGGWTDGQLKMALQAVGRRTDKHGSGGSWMDRRTDEQLCMALKEVGRTVTVHLVVKGCEGTDIRNAISFVVTVG